MAGLLLATAAAADPAIPRDPTDRIDVSPANELMELTWSDTEERLQGSIRPAYPREGQPLHVSLHVGSFEGDAFEGPLVLTLREAGATHGQTVTVKRGERDWQATFTPDSSGPHLLDVGFRTTRHKVIHASFEVGGPPVSRMLGWGVLGLGILVLLGYTVHNILGGERPEERAPVASAEEPTPPGPAPSTPAADTPPAAETPPTAEVPIAAIPPVSGAEAPTATEPPITSASPATGSETPADPPATAEEKPPSLP
ncbi:hypothetical protein JRI60_16825 [Archangium violaceum]|uniref:hypothetical protein n=1 Tax=Archangium violaceum TaxID=83451 RepID=UPI00194F591E|nr:hypothetical protein [Archangium violaceum]QRO00576.1 hypothetical protein JRI60_16825 [Archangium violaceum]